VPSTHPLRRYRPVSLAPLRDAFDRYYPLVAGLVPLVGVLAMGRPFLARHGLDAPLPHNDTVILEYVGWFLARGNTLYVDIWEIKPPLAFVPPYLFAHLSGGDVYAIHLAGIATTGLCFAVAAAAGARIVGRLTGAPLTGLTVGVCFLALPDLLYLPWLGYKAKALVFALGLPAVDLALRDRPRPSGVLAGLAVGVWQLGIIFPVVTTATAWATGGREAVRRHVGGGAVAAVAIVGVVLLLGDVEGFLAEVVLSPLALQTDDGPLRIATYLGYFPSAVGAGLTVAGLAGLVLAAVDDGLPDRFGVDPASLPELGDGVDGVAWPVVLGGLLVPGVLLVDFDGIWDMVTPLSFVAIGVGLLVGRLSRPRQILAVLVLLAVFTPTFAPSEFVRHEPIELEPSDGRPPALDPEREQLYWTGQPIQSCRFFGARTQRSLLEYTPDADQLADAPCGRLGPYLRAIEARVSTAGPEPTAAAGSASDDDTGVASGPAGRSGPPTVTPDPRTRVANGGIDVETTDTATVIAVPVVNEGASERTVRVRAAVTVRATGDRHVRCERVTLAAGEQAGVRLRFGGVRADGLALQVRVHGVGDRPACDRPTAGDRVGYGTATTR
jgi:hypothetical protein